MAKQLYGKNYADMSDKYKSKNTKQEFKDARSEQRGDIMMNGLPSKDKGNRKAGEALEADTPVATEAAESVKKAAGKAKGGKYKSGQQHYSEGELVSTGAPNKDYPGKDNNPYTVKKIENFDLAAGGAGAEKGTERLSAQDIKRLRKQGGFSRKEIVDYAENTDFGDGPGASGGKAQKLLGKYKDAIKAKQAGKAEEEVSEPVVEAAPAPTPTPVAQEIEGSAAIGDNSNAAGPQQAETAAGGGTQQNIQSGDGNISVNQQAIDNSRTYGGSYRNFEYTPSGNPATDTPVSAATMGGFYDVDDSPAANAARVDRQSDQNTELQKKYENPSFAQTAIDNAAANAYIDPAALDKRIAARGQNMFDMSTQMGANIFGDMFANGAPKWNSPQPAKPVEQPNFKVDDYIKF